MHAPGPDDPEVIRREGARVLVLDGAGRVLLLRGRDLRSDGSTDHDRPHYWITVGGGLDPGETARGAAVREVFEETGHRLDEDLLTGPVHEETVAFTVAGHRVRQHQCYFAVRVEAFVVDFANLEPVERQSVDGARWWSVAELHATPDRVFPPHLADLVAGADADLGRG